MLPPPSPDPVGVDLGHGPPVGYVRWERVCERAFVPGAKCRNLRIDTAPEITHNRSPALVRAL